MVERFFMLIFGSLVKKKKKKKMRVIYSTEKVRPPLKQPDNLYLFSTFVLCFAFGCVLRQRPHDTRLRTKLMISPNHSSSPSDSEGPALSPFSFSFL